MRIAIFSRVLFLSGVTTHIIDLTKELTVKGNKVFIFTSGAENIKSEANLQLIDKLKSVGGIIINIPFPKSSNSKIKYILKMIKSLPVIKKELASNAIDVIHVHTPALSFIPKLLNRKFVKTIHVKDLSLSFLNIKATHEITISRETYNESQQKFNYKKDELTLIFNGVDIRYSLLTDDETKNGIKTKFNISKNKIIIGIVGSIQYRKGHDVLLKAISELPIDIKNKIELVILGEGNKKDEKWLSNLVTENFLENIVIKLPFQDPKPFYDMMDIFVLPSRLEGFGLVVIEAMLSKCCVVRSDTEGAYDQISHGETGFIFKNENIEELKSILEHLIKDESLRERVALNGKKFALNNFTSDIMADNTLKVYQKVIDLK
ncbi:glycosyltransferase family 4 protein [Empedobacter falsenii]